MPTFDLMVAGEINPDLILNGQFDLEFGQAEKLIDSADLTIGSSSVIFACGAARLGLKTAFIGVCGDDLFGRFMLEKMQEHDIDTSNIKIISGGTTGLSVILNRGEDRMILTHPGLISALAADDVSEEILSQARHLHVASYFMQEKLQPRLPGLFQRAHELGLSTSLDTNFDPTGKWEGVAEVLAHTDIFFPNEREAKSIIRRSPDESIRILAQACGLVAMKCGAEGAKLAEKNHFLAVNSIQVKVVDTVGAGDSFDAGFLYGYLNQWDREKSLKLAIICGALSTQARGGTDGQPTLSQAMQYLW